MKKILSIGCCIAASATLASGVKISEKFGFDADDSTRFLQAALNSSEKEIILDRRDTPWIASPLLCTNGNKTIRIEDGAWLVAKRGEFHRNIDSLLVFRECKGIKLIGAGADRCGLRMWRDDYDNTNLYMHAEHRMGLSILSCEDVLIEGLTVCETGGDGLYISVADRFAGPCRNVTVRNCVFDKNYRQGISVISVDGLLIENVVMSNTKGTPPMAGIDFEPNNAREKLSRIVMRNCITTNNAGVGFAIVPNHFNSESEKVSITFENCHSVDDKRCGFAYATAFRRRDGYDAEIPYRENDVMLRNCSVTRSGKEGVWIYFRPLASGSFIMENCLLDNCGINDDKVADVSARVTSHDGFEPNVFEFRNVTIRQPKPRKWLDMGGRPQPFNGEPSRICGRVTVVSGGKTDTHTLDSAWRAANTPFTPCGKKESVHRVKADLSKIEIIDSAPDKTVKCAPVFVRRACSKRFVPMYVFYAEKGKMVNVDILVRSVAAEQPKVSFQLGKYGEAASSVYSKTFKREKAPIRFTAPETGFYSIRMRSKFRAATIAATSFNVPMAIDVSDGCIGIVGMKMPVKGFKGAKLYIDVAQGTKAFSAAYFGNGREALNAYFSDPDGNVAYEFEPVIGLRYARVDNPKSGMWTLNLNAPVKYKFENHSLSLNGVPGWYFLSPEKMWR